jgi:Lon-like protease
MPEPRERGVRAKLVTAIPVAILALCLGSIPLPMFVERPGPARDVVPRIDIEGPATYQPESPLYFTTVNYFAPTVYGAAWAWLSPDAVVVPQEAIIPRGITEEEYDRLNVSLMDQSQIAAVAASLRDLSDFPRDHGPGLIVYGTVPGSPADGRLFAGDLITEVDGVPVDGLGAFSAAVRAAGPGGTLRLRVRPLEGGKAETIPVHPARIRGRVLVGVELVPNFPFQVRFQTGDVSGPSAGLMWALGVTDILTPGDLAGGRSVAGTGVIDLTGNVGPIGGVTLKVLAAEDAGAEIFFLPRENLAEARTAGADLQLVPVATLDQAVGFLEGNR